MILTTLNWMCLTEEGSGDVEHPLHPVQSDDRRGMGRALQGDLRIWQWLLENCHIPSGQCWVSWTLFLQFNFASGNERKESRGHCLLCDYYLRGGSSSSSSSSNSWLGVRCNSDQVSGEWRVLIVGHKIVIIGMRRHECLMIQDSSIWRQSPCSLSLPDGSCLDPFHIPLPTWMGGKVRIDIISWWNKQKKMSMISLASWLWTVFCTAWEWKNAP